MAIRLQIVFQGGGAKLAALIAAAQAVQELESSGAVEVTRVAGASAGAIVAALLAMDIPMATVRERLQAKGGAVLKEAFPHRTTAGMFWKVFRGEPIYNEKAVRKFLHDIMQKDGARAETFKNLNKKLIIVAADIRNHTTIKYGDIETGRILDAIIDSCAMPFVFRSVKSGGNIVDGGLCENLPTDDLMRGVAQYGGVIGFSFTRNDERPDPDTVLGYAGALMSTAINNSVERASRLIGEGKVFKIKTNIDTFDFDDALNTGLNDDHYGRIKAESREWLGGIVQKWNEPSSDVAMLSKGYEVMGITEIMDRIARYHSRLHSVEKVIIDKAAIIVRANCLLPEGDSRKDMADDVEQTIEITATEPLYSFQMGLASSGASPVVGATTWRVLDKDNNEVDAIGVPVVMPSQNGGIMGMGHYVVFLFTPPLSPAGSPYKIIQRNTQKNALQDLYLKGEDYISNRSTQAKIIGRFDIIAYLPELFGSAVGENLTDSKKRLEIDGDPAIKWLPVKEMAAREVNEYDAAPRGFVARGWRAESVPSGHRVGVLLKK